MAAPSPSPFCIRGTSNLSTNKTQRAASSYTYKSGCSARYSQDARIPDHILEEDDDDDEQVILTMPGQGVAPSTQYMRGHGCYIDPSSSEIVSSMSGIVERVNKLISVRPIRTRYRAEVGDLVVGRIMEVQSRRWKVDIGTTTDASLQLSSVNLPGGVQRKKLESDELQMRMFFQEGDLVVAEVQSVFQDGSVGLHTRSLRYGKLRNGALAVIPPVLVRRHKSHFITLDKLPEHGIDLLLGLNGYVWVSKHIDFDVAKAEGEGGHHSVAAPPAMQVGANESVGLGGRGVAMDIDGVYSDVNEPISTETRRSITIVCIALAAFVHHGITVTESSLERACAWGIEQADLSDPITLAHSMIHMIRRYNNA